MRLAEIIKGVVEGTIRYVTVAKKKERPPRKESRKHLAKRKKKDYRAKRKKRLAMAKASRRINRRV